MSLSTLDLSQPEKFAQDINVLVPNSISSSSSTPISSPTGYKNASSPSLGFPGPTPSSSLAIPNPRRPSMTPPNRRPLRSSPLAGPALSGEGKIDVRDEKSSESDESIRIKSKSLKFSSTPNLSSYLTSRPGSAGSLSSGGNSSSGGQRPSDEVENSETGSSLASTERKRLSVSAISSLRSKSKRRSKDPSGSTEGSILVPPVPNPPIPLWALQQMPLPVVLVTSAETPLPGDSSSVPGKLDEISTPYSPDPSAQHPLQQKPSESWLTSNTYEDTPRFSRLGLGSSNVVLPVSARVHQKRLSRVNSSASMASNGSKHASSSTKRVSCPPGNTALASHSSPSDEIPKVPTFVLTRTSSESSKASSGPTTPLPSPNLYPDSVLEKTKTSPLPLALDKEEPEGDSHSRSQSRVNFNLSLQLRRISIRSKSKPDLRSLPGSPSCSAVSIPRRSSDDIPPVPKRFPGRFLVKEPVVAEKVLVDQTKKGGKANVKRSGTMWRMVRALNFSGKRQRATPHDA